MLQMIIYTATHLNGYSKGDHTCPYMEEREGHVTTTLSGRKVMQ